MVEIRRRARTTAALAAAVLLGAGGGGTEAAPADAAAQDTALQRMARELVPDVERRAGLSFRRPPRLARSSRRRLEAFLQDELSEQLPEEEARAIRDVYARMGLVPDTLDLRALLRGLYLEQVGGYYDPEADTLFVRDDVGDAQVRTVLLHELVHALQDQHLDLDSLMDARAEANDAATAAQAALEGHATFVMAEWQLAQTTGGQVDLTRMPDLAELMPASALDSLPSMPALSGAPRIIRESLVFPYLGGLSFLQQLWRSAPRRPSPLGRYLPASTEQVLHPERILSDPPDAPTEVRFGDAPAPWREVYTDGLGEMETRILLEVHLGESAVARAREAAAGWDGDRYRLLRTPGGADALIWVTVWDDPGEADAFRSALVEAWDARYGPDAGRTVRVERSEVDGRPVVTLVDRPAGEPELPPGAARPRLEGGA